MKSYTEKTDGIISHYELDEENKILYCTFRTGRRLTDWQIISDNAACFNLSMDKKYICDIPELNFRAVPVEK